jgi:hypothetical protein
MLRKTGAAVMALAVIIVPMMTAQNKPKLPAQPVVQAPRSTHGTIGAIKEVNTQTNTIVVTPIGGTDQSYAFAAHTTIHGLPGTPSLAVLGAKAGEQVVVHFAMIGDKAEALSIEYLGAAEIQRFEGVVVKVDPKARTFTVKPATAIAEDFVMAPRAVIDLKGGAVSLAQFAGLSNVHVTVFYTARHNEKLVRYLQEAPAPVVSMR